MEAITPAPATNIASDQTFQRFYPLLTLLTGGYFLLSTGLNLFHILTYKADFDITEFNSVFQSLLHTGGPFIVLSPSLTHVNWFGAVHFSPVFYLLLPLYALWPSPLALQIIHGACLSVTAIPMAFALRRLALNDKTILALIIMLLFNPFYISAGLWEFHEVSVACPLIATAYWALIARRRDVFLLMLALLLLTKEHFGLTVAGFGFLWWWRHRDGWFGFVVCIAGLAATWLVLEVIMPGLNNGYGHFMLSDNGQMQRYTWLKDSPREVLRAFWYLFFVQTPNAITGVMYLAALFFTVGFFPLLAPFYMLPGAADFATILLSAHFFPRSVAAYHSCTLIPVLVMAAGIGIARWQKYIPAWLPLYAFILLLMVVANIALFPKSRIAAYEFTEKSPVVNFALADKVRSLIGDESVSAQSNIAYLISGHAKLYPFPEGLDSSEFIVLYLRHPYANPYYYLLGDLYLLGPRFHYNLVFNILTRSPAWGIVLWEDDWLVLQRNAHSDIHARAEAIAQLRSLVDKGNRFRPTTADWSPFLP